MLPLTFPAFGSLFKVGAPGRWRDWLEQGKGPVWKDLLVPVCASSLLVGLQIFLGHLQLTLS